MDITSLGHSSFKLRGKSASLVTDPFETNKVGLPFPKHTVADIVTISHEHEDHNAKRAVEGNPFIISGPGEYEIKGVGIVGIGVYHDDVKGAKRGKNTMYRIEIDGISLVHLGDLGHEFSASEVDSLDGVDVLFVPVGGVYTIDPAQASKVVHEIEPTFVIPMHYNRPGMDQKIFGDMTGVEAFLKEMGKAGVPPVTKLTISKDKLPEEMQVVVLQ